jgi:O-6-methylguanine DNA methyltransferase
MLTVAEFLSALGPVSIAECKERILAVHFGDVSSLLAHHPALLERSCRSSAPLGPAGRSVRDYLAGRSDHPRAKVDLSLVTSEFDRLVLRRLYRTRPGQTLSYGELAREVGRPGAARAVGGAMRRNPIPILIPCHRVVTSSGAVGYYTGGVEKKVWLLERESSDGAHHAA